MKYVLWIPTLFVFQHIVGQSLVDREKKWQEQTYNTSLIDQFVYIDDSIHTVLAPMLQGGFENQQLAHSNGLEGYVSKKINERWTGKLFGNLNYTSNRANPYQSILQPQSFFSFEPLFLDLRGKLTYETVKKRYQFQAGMDQFHLGEGARSLFLSNQGVANPYMMSKVKLWKFEYQFINQVWRDGKEGHFQPKFNTTHILTFNHRNKISFSVFETVVQAFHDTLYNRGFEVEYLNPMIFFRPQEYSNGSSDNVILGLNGFIKLKYLTLYGQLIIDDINIAEIKNQSKWWANKYGLLGGIKGFAKLFQKEVFYRTEMSMVTPYTYSAMSFSSSYSNMGLPQAHVLGSNFAEWYTEVAWKNKQLSYQLWLQVYKKGITPIGSTSSYGDDVFTSYLIRPFGDYGYSLFIGDQMRSIQIGGLVSYALKKIPWQIYVEPRFYNRRLNDKLSNQVYFLVGIRTGLFQQVRNY